MAAKNFLVNLNLNKNELQNAVIQPLAVAPASGQLGQVYYNSTDKLLYQHNGTNWVAVGNLSAIKNFSKVKVGNTEIEADNNADTLELASDTDTTITLTPDATNDKVTLGQSVVHQTAPGAKGDTTAQTPTFGSTFKVTSGTVDKYGRVTAFADHNVTIPSATATTSAAGLMSSTDKTKLNGIASGAEVNVQSDWSQTNYSADDYIKNKPPITQSNSDWTFDNGADGITISTDFASIVFGGNSASLEITTANAQDIAISGGNGLSLSSGTDEISVDSNVITNLGTPTNPTDAATKGYVDTGLSAKEDSSNKKTTITASSTDTDYASSKAVYDFVNSSIENVAAYYLTKNAAGDPFATKAELTAAITNYPGTFYSGGAVRIPTKNDYLVVLADESKTETTTGIDPTTRYIVTVSGTASVAPTIAYQYTVNNSGLTAAQWDAVNSGITAAKVTSYDNIVSGAITAVNGTTGQIEVATSGQTRTISLADSGVTAGSKGDTTAQTPAFGGTFKVTSGTVDAKGRLTAFAEHNVTIPNAAATTSAAGLMSAADKTKLEGIAAGAEVNVQSDWSQTDNTADDYIKNTPPITHGADGWQFIADATEDTKLFLGIGTTAIELDDSSAATINLLADHVKVPTPTAYWDAANKSYVDTAVSGLIKTATGTIGTSATTATVAFTGTLLSTRTTQSGVEVVVEEEAVSGGMKFTVATAPTTAVTCTVVYI